VGSSCFGEKPLRERVQRVSTGVALKNAEQSGVGEPDLKIRLAEKTALTIGFGGGVVQCCEGALGRNPPVEKLWRKGHSKGRVGNSFVQLAPSRLCVQRIDFHSSNNACANCLASKGCKSSGCSPGPMNLMGRFFCQIVQ
jgi:hypothetical protein